MHARGVALRETVLRRQVQMMQDLVDLDIMSCFHEAMFEVLKTTDRSVMIAVVEKLSELHQRGAAGVYQAVQEARAEQEKRAANKPGARKTFGIERKRFGDAT